MADAPPGYDDGAEAEAPDQEEIPGDVDEPDLSLKTPGLKTDEKPDNLVVELADPTDAMNRDMYSSDVTFEDLGLSKELLEGIYNEMGFKKPSGIQAQTLPLILNPPYRPLIAQGHNGCGKTTCFTLAMLSKCVLILPSCHNVLVFLQASPPLDFSALALYPHKFAGDLCRAFSGRSIYILLFSLQG